MQVLVRDFWGRGLWGLRFGVIACNHGAIPGEALRWDVIRRQDTRSAALTLKA